MHLQYVQVALGTTKKNRLASANANALKLSCELLKSFVSGQVLHFRNYLVFSLSHVVSISYLKDFIGIGRGCAARCYNR
jgi:hypothetical protein